MKKNFFPMALMAIAMGLNACSSDDPVVNAGGGKAPFADGGYVKMAINMPSAPSSRAANDDFVNSDGLAKEYEVKNATLILFEGDDDENNAVFHSAYDLPVSMTKDGDTQITSTTKIVKNVENSVPNSQLYAYVVLNNNGLLDVATSTINVPSSTGTTTTTSLASMKFSDFRKTVVNGGADKFKKDGFLMDNAPLWNNSSSKITSLVDISGKVYRSKAEAEAKPATEIFVERALAKVTVADKTGATKKLQDGVKTITGATPIVSTDVNYTIAGWTLDVTNKSSYLGRNFNSAWKDITESESTTPTHRFVGTSLLRTTDLVRTYWAEDPNYGGASYTFSFGAFNYLGNGDGNLVNQKLDESTPLYCMENTFDVANQRVQQTTRAIVKVKIGTAGTFYTFNGDNSMLYDETNMKKRVLDAIKSSTAVMKKMSTSTQTVTKIEDTDIKDLKLGWVKTGEGTSTTLENECDGDGKIYVLSFSVKKADGTWIPIDNTTLGETLVDALHLREIMMYKEGYAYYPVLIKHFGDDLTPWNKTTADFTNPYGTTSSETNKYLGRYGVVRNNWYNIDIKSINNVGSAVVPNASKNASFDDKPENYISVRINVLSWAKRNQEEHL